jgi:hypothetical protein
MIACVHQPNFIPWMGFFAKIAASDTYVVMDNVQFPRNSWVNRVRVGGNGPPVWLTVPVRHASRLDIRIDEVEIGWESEWTRKHVTTLRQRYARSLWLREVLDPFEAVLARRHRLLAEQNLALIEAILRLCGIDRQIIRGSQLQAGGSGSVLIAAMCAEIGATEYLAGKGAADYEDLSVYADRGIGYRRTSYPNPEYPQRGSDAFEPGLSIVDALFNIGPQQTRELLLAAVPPQ